MENPDIHQGADKLEIDPEVLEEARRDFNDPSKFIQAIHNAPDNKKPYVVWGLAVGIVEPFLQRVLRGGELHLRSLQTGVKAAIDYAMDSQNQAIEEDLGHTLGKAVNRLASYPEAVDSEGLRKIVEFVGYIYECNDRPGTAFRMYKASFPEKYAEKIANAHPEENSYPGFMAQDLTDGEIHNKFSALMQEIKDDPFMNMDAEKGTLELFDECKKIVDAQ